MITPPTATTDSERSDLLATLAQQRRLLHLTTRNLTDDQARMRTTASALCLGGLVKHVTQIESNWVDFILGGADAMVHATQGWNPDHWSANFQMLPEESLNELLERYEQVALRTQEVLTTLPDLDLSHPLPPAPWFEPGLSWSARRVFLHIIAETAQHAGHADIIRESLDGAKTMG